MATKLAKAPLWLVSVIIGASLVNSASEAIALEDLEFNSDPMGQVTSVSQLSDV